MRNHIWAVKKSLTDYLKLSAIHGVHYLAESRSILEKIVWIIIFVASLIGCSYTIKDIYNKYDKTPVVINFANEAGNIQDLPFPAITLCPQSQINYTKFNLTKTYAKYANSGINSLNADESRKLETALTICKNLKIPNIGGGILKNRFFEVLDQISADWRSNRDGSICGYYNQGFTNDYCLKTFTPVLTRYGICYSFNILNEYEQFTEDYFVPTHFFKGLNKMKEFHPAVGYFNKINDSKFCYPERTYGSIASKGLFLAVGQRDVDLNYLCTYSKGFTMMLHTSWEEPVMTRNIYDIPLEVDMTFLVIPKVIQTDKAAEKYSPEKRGCYLTAERRLRFYKFYTQSNCLSECLANFTRETCGCVQYYMPRDQSTALCGNQKESCFAQAENEFNNGNVDFSCDCKPSCTYIRYEVDITMTEDNSKEKYDELLAVVGSDGRAGRELSKEYSHNKGIKLSMLNVHFAEDDFTPLQRAELYGVADLISNFGSLLGLFVGFTLISLAEIGYFLSVRIFCNYLLHK